MGASFPSGSNIDPKRSQNHRGFKKLWLNYLRTALTFENFPMISYKNHIKINEICFPKFFEKLLQNKHVGCLKHR